MQSLDDIFLWSDGTWCYRHEIDEMGHMSDDRKVITEGTAEHVAFLGSE